MSALKIEVTKELYALLQAGKIDRVFLSQTESNERHINESDGTVSITSKDGSSKPMIFHKTHVDKVGQGYKAPGYPAGMSVRYSSFRVFISPVKDQEKEVKKEVKAAEIKEKK